MNTLLARHCYDPRQGENRRLAVATLVLLAAGAVWHWTKNDLLYHAACSSIGCPGRVDLIAAVLRKVDSDFPETPQLWNYNCARPDWIAWSSVRVNIRLGPGSYRPMWQVKVADRHLVVKGVIAGDRLSVPPVDADGDGSCEVVKEFYPDRDEPRKDLRWWTVVRLGAEDNEIVWAGVMDIGIWHSRQIRLKPIWRDTDGDGMDELLFITVETFRTPEGIGFKPSRTIAVFEWTAPGGILRTRLLPDDCGIRPWNPENGVSMRVGQETDLDPIVRELLSVSEFP